jgi:hypothetical protein
MRVSVDKRGLRYEIDYDPDDADHQRVMAKMKRGDLTGSSFSFRIAPGGQKFVTGKGASDVRELLDVDVLDVGPVSFPAYASTSADARAGKRSVLLVPAEEICAEWRKARAAMGLGDAPIRLGLQQMREQLMRVERQQMLDRLRSIEASIRRPAGRERRATDLEFSYEACSTD